MIKVVGVHFRNAGKVYFFDPKGLELNMMDRVVVETARGIELGTVMTPPRDMEEEKVTQPLKAVVRKATEEDEAKERKNRDKEEDAYKKCKELIAKHELDMKLVGAEYTFDNSKLLFYFTSDGRVDFRELVKDLASVFRTRIELRQIGVRDETKILGGIGMCGREVCCKTFLSDFSPVSIKMAKTQNLSLNPTKISGLCGRLMCCLNNEEETYEYLNQQMPKMGDEIEAKDGTRGVVTNLSILKQKVKVVFEENGIKDAREYSVSDITVIGHKKKGQPQQPKKEKAEKPEDPKAVDESVKNEKEQENPKDKELKSNTSNPGPVKNKKKKKNKKPQGNREQEPKKDKKRESKKPEDNTGSGNAKNEAKQRPHKKRRHRHNKPNNGEATEKQKNSNNKNGMRTND